MGTPNAAETMTVEGTKTDNVMEEKKTELKEKKKDEEVKQFNFSQKPEVKHGWEGFLNFFWNPETGEFLGRNGMSWLKISVFYIIYYSFLTLFFMLMLLPSSLRWMIKSQAGTPQAMASSARTLA